MSAKKQLLSPFAPAVFRRRCQRPKARSPHFLKANARPLIPAPLFGPVLLVNIVDLRADQQNIHTEIHPQHQQRNGRQAAIHRKSVEFIHIHRQPKRKNRPGQGAEHAPWQLTAQRGLAVGQKLIQKRKEKDKHSHHNQGTKA